MTVISRTVRSIPHRPASETWNFIVDLLAPSQGDARSELQSVRGTACALIAEEVMSDSAIVVYGSGPRLRIYCLFQEDALEGDKASESALSFVPTEGDWKLSFPCPPADLEWVERALKAKSSRISARDKDAAVNDSESGPAAEKSLTVDKEAFLHL